MLTPLETLADVHRVAWRGRSVCWRAFGSGPPLVLLHGGHGNWMHWLRNIDALAARHRVWVPDMPGFGDSDDLDLPLHDPERLPQLVAALEGTLDTLLGRGTPLLLGGFSFGGLVAARLAAHRGHVTRLGLIGPGGHATPFRRFVELTNWRLDDPQQRAAVLRHNLEVFMLSERTRGDPLAEAVHAQACEATRFRSKEISRVGGLLAALDVAGCPVLVLWGGDDVTCVAENVGPMLVDGHPERHWDVLPGYGHWLQYEAADAVNRRLVDWFGGTG